jgi:hypothetical protein
VFEALAHKVFQVVYFTEKLSHDPDVDAVKRAAAPYFEGVLDQDACAYISSKETIYKKG